MKLVCAMVACGVLLPTPPAAVAQDQESPQDRPEAKLPTGHPRVASPPSGSSALPPVPVDSGTGAMALRWEAPENWVSEKPSSSMRRAQYRIPKAPDAAGDAQCVVYYFGPGQGGNARANAERWADQFDQPDGSSSREVMKTEEIEVNGLPVLIVEVAGTYSGGMASIRGQAQIMADYMLLGAVAEGPDANWFFKLTGPLETVASQRETFRKMITSLKKGS